MQADVSECSLVQLLGALQCNQHDLRTVLGGAGWCPASCMPAVLQAVPPPCTLLPVALQAVPPACYRQ
jgi:hypothetical protein